MADLLVFDAATRVPHTTRHFNRRGSRFVLPEACYRTSHCRYRFNILPTSDALKVRDGGHWWNADGFGKMASSRRVLLAVYLSVGRCTDDV